MQETDTFCPANRMAWRAWLMEHHQSEISVWLLLHKTGSGKPTISWSEAVDEALCFGWVDSRRRSVDADSFIQFFCRRKPKSTWSKINKDKVAQLIAQGLMQPAGVICIEAAQQNGSWSSLDQVEAGEIPADLKKAFDEHQGSAAFFEGLSRSVKKLILQWLMLAKQPITRVNRIKQIAESAAQRCKPF